MTDQPVKYRHREFEGTGLKVIKPRHSLKMLIVEDHHGKWWEARKENVEVIDGVVDVPLRYCLN